MSETPTPLSGHDVMTTPGAPSPSPALEFRRRGRPSDQGGTTMTFKNCRVLQIMPAAADWRAVFADENEQGLVIETHLAGWALIEAPEGSRAVVGFDAVGEVESCEALENFLGYAAPGETASRWHREAVRYFQEHAQPARR